MPNASTPDKQPLVIDRTGEKTKSELILDAIKKELNKQQLIAEGKEDAQDDAQNAAPDLGVLTSLCKLTEFEFDEECDDYEEQGLPYNLIFFMFRGELCALISQDLRLDDLIRCKETWEELEKRIRSALCKFSVTDRNVGAFEKLLAQAAHSNDCAADQNDFLDGLYDLAEQLEEDEKNSILDIFQSLLVSNKKQKLTHDD